MHSGRGGEGPSHLYMLLITCWDRYTTSHLSSSDGMTMACNRNKASSSEPFPCLFTKHNVVGLFCFVLFQLGSLFITHGPFDDAHSW